jgi:hypothetical protein
MARTKTGRAGSSPKRGGEKSQSEELDAVEPARQVPATTPAAVRVRMYRQGLGDCFLLAFPRAEGGDFHVLIDCGVILGTPDADAWMARVVADVAKTTGGVIDILVGTHEHWDHVAAFEPSAGLFRAFTIKEVWLAWTEDPNDAAANRLRQERTERLAALWVGLSELKQRLGVDPAGQARATLARAAEVLSFFGIDAAVDAPPAAGLGAAAAVAEGKTAVAMRWLRSACENTKYLRPGGVVELPEARGVRAYVLGPPTDLALLRKDSPSRSSRETYDEPTRPAAAEHAFFARGARGAASAGFDRSQPFDSKYRIAQDDAQGLEFFRDRYFGSGRDESDAWRRIDGDWMAGAAALALQLDSDTNNTSLALAFELPDGRVLLFPGDAQVGNWESWHTDSHGTKQVWKVGGRDVTAETLLNRTVFYKVGHHGSHNATLRDGGLEMMTDLRLVAMVPVDFHVARDVKGWAKMPFGPLLARLDELAKGRVILADETVEALRAKVASTSPKHDAVVAFLANFRDSDERIQVLDAKGQPAERPLYVDYLIP